MADALLSQWYRDLPHFKTGDDPDLWAGRMHQALRSLRRKIRNRYSEGTLQRLLTNPSAEVRRASVLALGLTGTISSNAALAQALHDSDDLTAKTASDSLWEIWFRAGCDDANIELQRILHLTNECDIMAGLDSIIKQWPDFAEPWNQRAIQWFERGEYKRSIADCKQALAYNPHHFAAQLGMAECYLKLRKYNAALRSFRNALDMNPTLEHVQGMIRVLEKAVEGG